MNKKTYKSSTSGRRVVVGHDEYVNQRTGQIEEFAVIRVQQADFNFEKIWLYRLIEALDLAGGAKIKVLMWMIDQRDRENRVIATQARIAEEVGVSRRTVSDLLSEMKSDGLVSSPQSGVYRLDPNLIWKGRHTTRMNVLMTFEEEVKVAANGEKKPPSSEEEIAAAE